MTDDAARSVHSPIQVTAAELVKDWNEGDGSLAALLFEIGDEEGWS